MAVNVNETETKYDAPSLPALDALVAQLAW
jgi:hypothetical protein